MKWACFVGLACCTTSPTTQVPSDFELQVDYRLDPTVTGQYNGFTYAGGETIEVDLVYPDFEMGALDDSHVLTFWMGSNTASVAAGPTCYDITGSDAPYREVDDYQVLGWTGSATVDLEGMGTCYFGSDVIGWIE
jgi:hypothetical protein